MISCKRAAELISKQLDEPLSVKEEVLLKVHLFICEFCEQFRTHLQNVRGHMKRDCEEPVDQETCEKLCNEAKARIKKSCGESCD